MSLVVSSVTRQDNTKGRHILTQLLGPRQCVRGNNRICHISSLCLSVTLIAPIHHLPVIHSSSFPLSYNPNPLSESLKISLCSAKRRRPLRICNVPYSSGLVWLASGWATSSNNQFCHTRVVTVGSSLYSANPGRPKVPLPQCSLGKVICNHELAALHTIFVECLRERREDCRVRASAVVLRP